MPRSFRSSLPWSAGALLVFLSLPSLSAAGLEASRPLRVRVGLATDLERLVLPCCEGSPVVVLGERRRSLDGPVAVEPAPAAVEPSTFRLQIAALKDEQQGAALARRLEGLLGPPADSRFDAATDLYRVRAGRYPTREAADQALSTLASKGIRTGWVVSEGGGLSDPALRVTLEGRATLVRGRWLAVEPGAGGLGVTVGPLPERPGRRRYRGRLLVYLNDRGRLNLINDLSLEDYLKGVVPQEMGPSLYNQAEAIKAQAVAARTYTLRHLGEFVAEGYDICATPRCQVYGGLATEHPLSNQAVAETAGEVVVYRPKADAPRRLIDARYTATCGGHTEDVGVVFPLVVGEPYLRGVPCVEAGGTALAGSLAPGIPLEQGLARRLVPSGSADPRADLEARLLALARSAELPLPEDRLATVERQEVRRFLASIFDLALDPRLFGALSGAPSNGVALLSTSSAEWSPRQRRQARSLVASGLFEGSPGDELTAGQSRDRLLFHLAEALGILRREEGLFLSLDDGRLSLRGAEEERFEERDLLLPPELATFLEPRVGSFQKSSAESTRHLQLMAGDPLTLFWRGADLLGVLQRVDPVRGDAAGLAGHQGSQRSPWTRFRSQRQLAAAVELRYPGFGLRDFEVLGHGASGRVARVRLLGAGEPVEIEGLAIRWMFEIPETWFTVRRQKDRSGTTGWLFQGRGWGHGVGLCQVGAFGMARRGISYQHILAHYYPGAELARLSRPTG